MEQMHQDGLNLANQLFFAHGDPHAVWKRLRAEDPVHWTDGGLSRGFWSVTKLEDVQAVYRDGATFKSDCRFNGRAPLISSPLSSAGLGVTFTVSFKYCCISASIPDTAPAARLVPDSYR